MPPSTRLGEHPPPQYGSEGSAGCCAGGKPGVPGGGRGGGSPTSQRHRRASLPRWRYRTASTRKPLSAHPADSSPREKKVAGVKKEGGNLLRGNPAMYEVHLRLPDCRQDTEWIVKF